MSLAAEAAATVRAAPAVPAGSKPAEGALAVHTAAFAAFDASAWEAVAPERRTPMQQHIWARAAAETYGPGGEAAVVAVGPREVPHALAPLTRTPGPAAHLRLLGAEEISESVEVAYRSTEALDALARGLAATDMPIRFGHYLADTPFIDALRRAYRGRGIVVARQLHVRGCPSIQLDRSWLDPETHFSSRRRSDLRRMQRTAERMGRVTAEILAPTRETVAAIVDEAMAVEAEGWKGRAGTALLRDTALARFYRRYTELAAEAGILRVAFLRIDGVPAAMQLALETENRFWLLKIGYDERFRKCSPGNLLIRETIRHAASRGLASYEFLGKEATWTEVWTTVARPVVALRTYPFNLRGAVMAAADACHLARQKLADRLERRAISRQQPAPTGEVSDA